MCVLSRPQPATVIIWPHLSNYFGVNHTKFLESNCRDMTSLKQSQNLSLVIELRYQLLKLATSFGPIQPNVFSRAASGSGSNVAVKVIWISFCTAKK